MPAPAPGAAPRPAARPARRDAAQPRVGAVRASQKLPDRAVTAIDAAASGRQMPGMSLADSALRIAYRIAFRLLRLWWYLRRPDQHGAMVAVWSGGRVLVLRLSYRRTLELPGGSIARRESAAAAACRELGEETGLLARPGDLRHGREIVLWRDYRRDHVTVFEFVVADPPPALVIDRREVVAAEFMAPEAALRAAPSPFLRAYLECAAVPSPLLGATAREGSG
jgi:8-oxo-dGTP diphosphatase